MRRYTSLLVVTIIIVFSSLLSWAVLFRLNRVSDLVIGLVVGGYEQYTRLHVQTILSEIADNPSLQILTPESCEAFSDVKEHNKEFFAVLAIGDKNGNAICTADPAINNVNLPSMVDRLYFQNVKTSKSLVTGEYALSRTTGNPVLHYAYPILDKNNLFNGFILAGVDLRWFINDTVDQYFKDNDMQVVAVDQAGKLLFSYPSDRRLIGQPVFDVQTVNRILSGTNNYFIRRDAVGRLRIYTYERLPNGLDDHMMVLVGFAIDSFVVLIVLALVVGIATAFYVAIVAGQWGRR